MVDKAGADQGLRDREKLSILPCRPFYFGHADDTRVSDSDQETGQNVRGAREPHATAEQQHKCELLIIFWRIFFPKVAFWKIITRRVVLVRIKE